MEIEPSQRHLELPAKLCQFRLDSFPIFSKANLLLPFGPKIRAVLFKSLSHIGPTTAPGIQSLGYDEVYMISNSTQYFLRVSEAGQDRPNEGVRGNPPRMKLFKGLYSPGREARPGLKSFSHGIVCRRDAEADFAFLQPADQMEEHLSSD